MDSSWFFMMNYWRKHHNLFSLKSWIIERSTNYTRFNLQSYEQRSKWTKKRFNLQSYEQRSKWTKKWTMIVSGLKKEFIIVCTNASILRYFIEVSSLLSSFLFALYLYNFCCWWDISDLVSKRAALTRWNNSGAPTHGPPLTPPSSRLLYWLGDPSPRISSAQSNGDGGMFHYVFSFVLASLVPISILSLYLLLGSLIPISRLKPLQGCWSGLTKEIVE